MSCFLERSCRNFKYCSFVSFASQKQATIKTFCLQHMLHITLANRKTCLTNV